MYWPCSVPQIFAAPAREGEDASGGDSKVEEEDDSLRSHVHNATQSNGSETAATHETQFDENEQSDETAIIDLKVARSEHIFTTITRARLFVWSLRPVLVLATVRRSQKSLQTYGRNASVLFRPDASTVVVRSERNYLLIYSVEVDHNVRVYQQHYLNQQSRRQSTFRVYAGNESSGIPEIQLRYRRAVKIDAGVNAILPLDEEFVIATTKPAAAQCIRWEQQKDAPQAVAQLLSKMDWLQQKSQIRDMIHDRAMNLSVWLSMDGCAYAVQKTRPRLNRSQSSNDSLPSSSASSTTPGTRLFDGYCFHDCAETNEVAILSSINARFSLIALATQSGKILCYAAKDYVGNIPLSHNFQQPASFAATGPVKCLSWSPDGYCLFAGYQNGWATWSVFGKEGASSFGASTTHANANGEAWLLDTATASWISGGSELLLTCSQDSKIYKLDMSRSAAAGCFSCANLVRALLQSSTEVTIYRGHEMPDLTSISNETSLWHHAQYPSAYALNHWPIKHCVASQDGRYIAIAGRRGLAHYSVQSGRWKTFSELDAENSFAVRGGMCWFNHILAVATEHAGGYDLRLYSRELDLGRFPLHAEPFSMPIVFVGPSGEDSLLIYTHENVLYHYVINITQSGAQLVQVGQIAFHGVVRAPSRVRSVSWVVPDSQLRNGDPSRDVEFASVLFLVDDKLVLLQPSHSPAEDLRYDMKVIAQHVEYYILMRDQIYFNFISTGDESMPPTPSPETTFGSSRSQAHYSLRDSLWIFSGTDLRMWPDVRDIIHYAAEGKLTTDAPLLSMPVDFYPLSILLTKGIVLGIESELIQRRGVSFALYRSTIRTQLFIPYVLKHQLITSHDTAAAFALANQYQHLSYFPHALEILLHHVLDEEVDRKRDSTNQEAADVDEQEPLPAVLSFLQMVLTKSSYLTTVVQCIRKTELGFWHTLFAHLPPPLALFEQALELEDLKTATGYLIVLQGLQEEEKTGNMDMKHFEQHVIRVMKVATAKADYELSSELARFLMGIDPRGDVLRRVMKAVGFNGKARLLEPDGALNLDTTGDVDTIRRKKTRELVSPEHDESPNVVVTPSEGGGYFPAAPGNV